jgi:hypothetical protein
LFVTLALLLVAQITHAQNPFTIHILEPADGAVISGPFKLRGDSTIPAEQQVTLRITDTNSGKVLANQPLALTGTVGTQGNFDLVINFKTNGDTPVLLEVLYTSKDGSITANAQVHVTLKAGAPTLVATAATGQPEQSALEASLAAVKLALGDYEARVQVVTPLPVSIQDQSFNDSCLGLARTNEQCVAAGTVEGKIVKLSYGGAAYTYHVGGDQARLDVDASAPIKQKVETIPKLINDAMSVTGVKLYVPRRLVGPFQGLQLSKINWDNGIVTLKYSIEGNPTDIDITEQILVPGAAIPAAGTGENIKLGSSNVPIQSVNGRRLIVWPVEGTLVSLSVPGSVSTAALTDLATGFALVGSTEPGQINPYDLAQFDRLTLALPEPMRSVEMARQALMSVLRPPRKGKVISVVGTTFKDKCLALVRQQEAACTQSPTPGYVIGIADTELYRYHVAGDAVRLNRENSDLLDKISVEYASVEDAQGFVQFPIVAPKSDDMILMGVQVGTTGVMLTYRDQKTGGVFALLERNAASATGSTINNNGNGISEVFFVKVGADQVQIVVWASPEFGKDGLTRIKNAIAGKQ